MTCAKCQHLFTNDEIRMGHLRYIQGLEICLPCERTILTEWAETMKGGHAAHS